MEKEQENSSGIITDSEVITPENDKQELVTSPAKRSTSVMDTKASNFLDPNLYIQMKTLANDFIESKSIPSVWATSSQVLVGLQVGLEMGMKPMEAMNSLYPVNGAINVWGKATTRRLKEHGWTIKYSDETQESCTATVSKGDESYTETFVFGDAELSGYTKDSSGRLKVGWREGMNRRKKLRYGVLSLIISTYLPEVLGSAMGIVEVSDDYDLGTNKNPKITNTSEKVKSIAEAVKNEG